MSDLGDRMSDLGGTVRKATKEELGTRADSAPRPTGQELVDAMSAEEQDAAFGPAVAEKIRAGEITLADLVTVTAPGDAPGFLVQRPLSDL